MNYFHENITKRLRNCVNSIGFTSNATCGGVFEMATLYNDLIYAIILMTFN